MNYFAHAIAFFDEPYLMAGTAVPDWLTVVDRPVRLRRPLVKPFLDDGDPILAAVARGALQHLLDDDRFHRSRAFAELQLQLIRATRDLLGETTGFRPAFLGHLLVEVLLDAALIADDPEQLERYYDVLDTVEPQRVEDAVNRMARQPTDRLASFIGAFRRHRILFDYLDDAKLFTRLNQVMRRVQFEPLPGRFIELLPEARQMVAARREELLEGTPVKTT